MQISSSIAEFVEFCNETQRRLRWATEYNKRSAEQLRAREQFEQQGKEETLERRTAVVNRVVGELKDHGFKFKSLGSVAANIVSESSVA